MVVELKFPDSFYNKDRVNYDNFFKALQLMLNRMAVSHEKYQGERTMDDCQAAFDEVRSMCQRLAMYDKTYIKTEDLFNIANPKPLHTGNTENLLDVANMAVIEFLFPKHPKAKFKAQTTKESPGLEYIEDRN
jgi:hypothetical protein